MNIASLQKRALRALGLAGLAGGIALSSAVAVQSEPRAVIQPYLEIQQVLSADLNGGDVLTYTAVGGGIDVAVATRRVEATISYNYQHRTGWGDDLTDDDVHTGLAAARIAVVPDMLNFDAGALAVRSQADIRTPSTPFKSADDRNAVEVYSVYAGPTLATRAGPVDVGASYRLGYVAVDDHSLAGVAPPAGQPRIDRFASSTVQSAAVSVGMEAGELPFGWTVGAGWEREDAERLDSDFEGKYVRGDVVVPVSSHLALTAGAGYEKFQSSQQDIVRDSNGNPVVTPGGALIADPSRPRLVALDQSGWIWDGGLIWRPSRRTELQARVGRRYGGTTFTGSLEHRINEAYGISASVYDSVDSFGSLLVTDLAGVPRKFNNKRSNTGLTGIGGCVLGNDPGSGACFDDALQSINNFSFRTRGADILYSGGRGPWSFGVGAGFNQHRYYAPPTTGNIFVLDGVTDESYSLSANASRRLTRSSGYDLNAYATWLDSGIAGSGTSSSTGITGSYYRSLFNEHIQANVAAGIYHNDAGEFDSTVASILFGLRYNF
jgi:hypothetical protein